MTIDHKSVAKSMTLDDVALYPFAVADVTTTYVEWINDPEVMRFTEARWTNHTLESAREYVRMSNESANAQLFKIAVKDRHVGNLRLSAIDFRHRRAEVALIIGEQTARGRGVGTRAILIASAHAFVTLSLHKLLAGVYVENQASVRAFERAGFKEAARFKDHYVFEGTFIDGVVLEQLSPLSGQNIQ